MRAAPGLKDWNGISFCGDAFLPEFRMTTNKLSFWICAVKSLEFLVLACCHWAKARPWLCRAMKSQSATPSFPVSDSQCWGYSTSHYVESFAWLLWLSQKSSHLQSRCFTNSPSCQHLNDSYLTTLPQLVVLAFFSKEKQGSRNGGRRRKEGRDGWLTLLPSTVLVPWSHMCAC